MSRVSRSRVPASGLTRLRRFAATFGGAAVVLVLGIVTYDGTARTRASRAAVGHTRAVIETTLVTFSALQEAESGQRGYLLTGEAEYLAPYRQALAALTTDTAALRRLTRDNPAQQRRLDTLGSLVDAKLAELRATIDLRRDDGAAAALAVVQTGRGRRSMDDIRGVLRAMRVEERALLAARIATEERHARRATIVLVGGTLAAGLLALLVNGLLTRHAAAQETAARALDAQNAELDAQNAQLQEQAAELEMQSSHLHEQAMELEVANAELRETGVALTARTLEAEQARTAAEDARGVAEALAVERSTTLGQLVDGVIVTDAAGAITFVNAAAHTQHGVAALGVGVDGYTATYHLLTMDGAPYPPEELPLARAVLHGETVLDADWRIRRPDGTEIVACGSAVPIIAHGRQVGAVLTIRDVTRLRALEQEREGLHAAEHQARLAADEANAAKSHFLTTMSHELRTPLNAISGYVDLLTMGLRGPVTDAQHEDLRRIKRSGQHLLSLVNDILNLARIETGRVELRVTDVPLAALAEDVEALVAPQMRARGLVYTNAICDAALSARADGEKVQQILLNLLTNACKFTEPGGQVTMECGAATGDGDGERVAMRVRDSGRGIVADKLASIFEPFVQIDRRLTHDSQQGVGLGLAISRELARAMAGDLTVESTPGQGSTFTLVLPRSARGVALPGGDRALELPGSLGLPTRPSDG